MEPWQWRAVKSIHHPKLWLIWGFNFTSYTQIHKWLVSYEITWLSEQEDARWKTKLVGWHSLRPRFNEVGESVIHVNSIKFFKSEHRILSHIPDSSSWTWHCAAQWPTVVYAHWDRDPHPWSDYLKALGRIWVPTLPESTESLITPRREIL